MSRSPKNKRRHSKRPTIIWFLVIFVLAIITTAVYFLLLQPREVKQSKQSTEVQAEHLQTEKNPQTTQSRKPKKRKILKLAKLIRLQNNMKIPIPTRPLNLPALLPILVKTIII